MMKQRRCRRRIAGVWFSRSEPGLWISEDGRFAIVHTIDAPSGRPRRDWHRQWELRMADRDGLDGLIVGALEFSSPRIADALAERVLRRGEARVERLGES